MSTPRVSIVMPTRNRAALAPRAIAGVLAQTLTDWELIIVDDASTDATPEMIARHAGADSRIRSIRTDAPRGAPAARNLGIGAARAELVAFIDDDDEWLPTKLERQVDAFKGTAPGTGVVHTAFTETDAGGVERIVGDFRAPDGVALGALLQGNRLGQSTVVARRTVLNDVGGFDERLPRLQDWDLWIRLAMVTRFAFVPDPLARIRWTPGSISTDRDAIRAACDILAVKFETHGGLERAQYAELCYSLGQLLMRNACMADGRRLVRRSLRLRPWPPSRIAGGLIALAGQRPYLGAASLYARALEARGRWDTDGPTAVTVTRPMMPAVPGYVSIIVPTFNDREWICDAVDSALTQSYAACEIIIVDDGSTDGTDALIRERYGDRIRCVRQTKRGPAAARNTGLLLAYGEYVQFLDADDVLLPAKVETHVRALEAHPEYGVVYCDFAFIDGHDATTTTPSAFQSRYRSGQVWWQLLEDNFIVMHAAMTRRAAIDSVRGFDETLHTNGPEDYDLWLRLAAAGVLFLHTPEPLVLYRRRLGSRSGNAPRQIAGTIDVIRRVPSYASLDARDLHLHGRRLASLREMMVRALASEGLTLLRQRRVAKAASRLLRAATYDPVGIPHRFIAVGARVLQRVRERISPLAAKRPRE